VPSEHARHRAVVLEIIRLPEAMANVGVANPPAWRGGL
jgi:hypothetical protein